MHHKLKIITTALILNAALASLACANDDAKARNLINSQGCKACHTLEGDGGIAAVSFEAMRAKLTRDQVRSQLVNPTHMHGNAKIPDFSHLSGNDIEALINFIQPKL